MLRMRLRGYQLGHGNFNVFNADEIACRRNLRERAFTDWKAVTLFLLRGVTSDHHLRGNLHAVNLTMPWEPQPIHVPTPNKAITLETAVDLTP
jgi:hypothetical protein